MGLVCNAKIYKTVHLKLNNLKGEIMEHKPLEVIISELETIIRKYGYFYISEIELVSKSGDFETITKQQRKLKI